MIDFLPPLLVIFTVGFSISDKFSEEEMTAPKQWYYVLLAFTSILLWLKFLLFLRVFPYFAYIIQMMYATIEELWPFMTVTLLSVWGFADAFYSLALFNIFEEIHKNEAESGASFETNQSALRQLSDEVAEGGGGEGEEEANFIQNFSDSLTFSFTATLGGWDGDDLDQLNFVGWVLFVMLAILDLIVLLNFVIAIITEVYMNVRDKQVESTYEEKAKLILDVTENPIIQPWLSQIFGASENQILYFATEMNSQRL